MDNPDDQLQWLPDSLRTALDDLRNNGCKSTAAKATAAGVVLGAVARSLHRGMQEGPRVYCQRNPWTEEIMARLSKHEGSPLRRYYSGLPSINGHLSTLFGFVRVTWHTSLPSSRELLTTADGGHFALDWYREDIRDTEHVKEEVKTKPIILVLHGVNGHGDESYMRHLAHLISKKGWRAVAMTFRGCGDLLLSSSRSYNAGYTEDIHQAVTTIAARFPESPLFLVGFSLGANLMVKYLGEKSDDTTVAGAVAISNPWCFLPHVETLHNPRNPRWNLAARIYSMLMAYEYKRYVRRHQDQLPVDAEIKKKLDAFHNLRALDEHVTVPVWGFRDLDHYLTESSCSEYLDQVKVPLLGINALDDPVVSHEALNYTLRKASANPLVMLVTTRRGGHIGWGEGLAHLWDGSWAERLCVDFLSVLVQMKDAKGEGGRPGGRRGGLGDVGARDGLHAPIRSRL